MEDKKLQELIVKHGLAYHHAGLSTSDRETVETLFRQSKICVLCSTSTLATGVNLPAHLVIIKSTLQYTEAGYSEYNDLDIRQMIGRAGRAGYDTCGVAVILTSSQTEHIYRTISEGKLEIDSQLLHSFIEFLNTEISNQNIQSFSDAMKWLSYTFLHVRMSINPSKYSLKATESVQSQLERNKEYLYFISICLFRFNEIVFEGIGADWCHRIHGNHATNPINSTGTSNDPKFHQIQKPQRTPEILLHSSNRNLRSPQTR